MTDLELLVDHLALQKMDSQTYHGKCTPQNFPNVFGGQVLAQALSAAMRTVPSERIVHSMHAYFLLPGNIHKPIDYAVDPIRDGGSFSTRRVVANQEDRIIFNTSISFQLLEKGLEHQISMPSATPPEQLISEQQRWAETADKQPDKFKPWKFNPVDTRMVDANSHDAPKAKEPSSKIWFKTNGTLPDVPRLHQQILAYISDKHLLGTALRPHGLGFTTPNLQVTSLDHSLWFHDDFRVDEWMLYVTDSPQSARGRGLSRGSIYTADGRLVASTVQESLMRVRG
jgi:acyl-CoA thioesterase-2